MRGTICITPPPQRLRRWSLPPPRAARRQRGIVRKRRPGRGRSLGTLPMYPVWSGRICICEPIKMTTQCAKVSRLKRPIPADLLLHIEQKLLPVRSSVTDCAGERIRRWNLGDSAGSARHSVAVEQVGSALRLIRLRSQSCRPRDIAGYVKVRVGCVLVTEDTEVRANNQGGSCGVSEGQPGRKSAGAQSCCTGCSSAHPEAPRCCKPAVGWPR